MDDEHSTTTSVTVEVTGHDPMPVGDDTAVSIVVDDVPVLGILFDAATGHLTVGTWDDDGHWIPIHTQRPPR